MKKSYWAGLITGAFAGMIGGIRAVWQSDKKNKGGDDSSILQK